MLLRDLYNNNITELSARTLPQSTLLIRVDMTDNLIAKISPNTLSTRTCPATMYVCRLSCVLQLRAGFWPFLPKPRCNQ